VSERVPDLPALRLVLAVGRTGSIGAAARELGVTQQSASARLRAVEAQLGLTLVQRDRSGSRLTAEGVVVSEWAARLVDLADEIEVALDGLRGARSRDLVVWASMTIADGLMPRWLVQLRQRQVQQGDEPTVVSLTAANSSQVEAAVLAGTAHLGFVEGVGRPRRLRSRIVGSDDLVLVVAAGDRLARRRTPLTPAEVAALPLTGREAGSGTRDVVARALAAHGLEPHAAAVELTTTTAVREAVLAGSAPAFLGRRAVARQVEAGDLVVVPTTLDLRRLLRAVWVGSAHPPAGPARDLVAIARRTLTA
jgi:molybdate transport repressor ModE-like protein